MTIDSNAIWEFFSPFAHIPGRYEWCRIHSPTHGSFDSFILLGESTSVPPTVYVNAENGERFMRDRYPESLAFRVAPGRLRIRASADGCAVRGFLAAGVGPVRTAEMVLTADTYSIPSTVPYGGKDFPVWGGRWSCEGVDLVREAKCSGSVHFADGRKERLRDLPAVVTAGSFAKIQEFRP